MRAFSIWLVLLQHWGFEVPGLSPLKIGGIGVEIFFVLSGFLIGGILFREIDKAQSFNRTLSTFWTRRWLRILPLYYAVLLFKFIFIDQSIGWNLWYYVLFLQNNFYGIQFLDVSWSLVIEEWFYLFTPIFLLFAFRIFKTKSKVLMAMFCFVIFINMIRFIYVYQYDVPFQGVNSNFPFRFDSLFLGVIMAFAHHNKSKIFEMPISKKLFGIGLLLFFGYLFYFWTLSYRCNLINSSLIPRTLGFFILPFSISLTIPFMTGINMDYAESKRFGKIIWRFISTTSILTYGIYLIHPFVYDMKLNFAITILITYAISWIIYNYFERPILRFRDKITGFKLAHK